MRKTVTLLLMLLGFATAFAQTEADDGVQAADIDDPAFVPTVKVSKVVDQGDSIPYMVETLW